MTQLAPNALATEVVPIDSLVHFPGNAREGDVGAIIESLRFHGQYRPLVVQRSTSYVLAGNHTLKAARELDWEEIAVTFVDVGDDQAKRINAVDNRTNDLASYDTQALLDMLTDLPDLEGTGFDDDALQELFEQLDDAPAVADDGGAAIYEADSIIRHAFNYYRQAGFPDRDKLLHEGMQEINRLAQSPSDVLIGTTYGYALADTYHSHRWRARAAKMKTPVEAFNDDKLLEKALRIIVENGEMITDTSLLSKLTFVSGTQAVSNFRPGFALALYRRFTDENSIVLDTSTGYGGRLVGFMASGAKHYVGIDPNLRTCEGNARLVDDYGFADRVTIIEKPAEDVGLLDSEHLQAGCDFAFTSPPYFCKEQYADDETQSWVRYKDGDAWREGFLQPMMRLQFEALKPGSYAAVNIADIRIGKNEFALTDWCIEAAELAGFVLVKEERFALSRVPGSKQKDSFEPVFIFRKAGDLG